jgi:hypothetical protein
MHTDSLVVGGWLLVKSDELASEARQPSSSTNNQQPTTIPH